MGLLASFDTLIREHGSASIRADQIALLRDEISVFDRKLVEATTLISQLTEKNLQLQSANEQACSKLRDLEHIIDENNQFTEHSGAYFKKDGCGGYHDAVYCYNCRLSTTLQGQGSPANKKYTCKCGWQSSFALRDVHSIRASIT